MLDLPLAGSPVWPALFDASIVASLLLGAILAWRLLSRFPITQLAVALLFAWALVAFVFLGKPALLAGVLLWSTLALVLGVPVIRRKVFQAPLARLVRRLPAMSETDKAAVHAGSSGFEGTLMNGCVEDAWWDIASPVLSAEEQAFIDGPVETLLSTFNDWQVMHELQDLPPATLDFLREHGFFGLIIPKAFGGLGFSAHAHSLILQRLASVSGTLASTVAVPNSLGPAELLLHHGTDAQRAHYLPRLARGEDIPCFALTSQQAGSDATSLTDEAVVVALPGHTIDTPLLGLRLRAAKRYITLAPVATLIGLAVRVKDPDGLLGGEVDRGITLVLVPRDTPGVEVGARYLPMGVPFQNGPVRVNDAVVPVEQVIGGVAGIGQGWRMLVECLSVGRAISLPSMATGGMQAALALASGYAAIREQFGHPIASFEGIQELLARSAARTYASTALSAAASEAVDKGEKPAALSAMAKYHCTETARRVAQDAMDILGGKAIVLGPSNPMAAAWQGLPIAITVEGANVLTRNLMIVGQGLFAAHQEARALLVVQEAPAGAARIKALDQALMRYTSRLVRLIGCSWHAFWMGPAELPSLDEDKTLSGARQVIEMFAIKLAIAADICLITQGAALRRREALTARLGDAWSALVMACAILRQHTRHAYPEEERAVVELALREQLLAASVAFDGLAGNLGRAGRLLAWQRTPRIHCPTDALVARAAASLGSPEAAAVFASNAWTRPTPTHPLGRIVTLARQAPDYARQERALRRLARIHGQQTGADLWEAARLRGWIDEEVFTRHQAWKRAIEAELDVDAMTPAGVFVKTHAL